MYPWRFLSAAFASTLLGVVGLCADLSVQAHWPVGGGPLFDYLKVDPANHRLFAAHGPSVVVLDTDTGKVIGEISGLKRTHGIVLLPALGRGFITDGDLNVVVVFDLKTLAKIGQINSGGIKPDGIEYDPSSELLYVANGSSSDLVAIDPVTLSIKGKVHLEGKLEGLVLNGAGRLFVNTEDKSEVQVVDTATMSRVAQWSVAPGEGGTGLAIDVPRHRLYSACGNRLLVILDSDTGRLVGTVAIGEDPDGAAFDDKRGLIYTSNLDGSLSLIHVDSADHYSAAGSVETEFGARTLSLDEASGRIYLPGGKFGPAPLPTPAVPEPKRALIEGTFEILMVGPK